MDYLICLCAWLLCITGAVAAIVLFCRTIRLLVTGVF